MAEKNFTSLRRYAICGQIIVLIILNLYECTQKLNYFWKKAMSAKPYSSIVYTYNI
jgi:hypothetical protein